MSDFSEHDEPTRAADRGPERPPQPGFWQSADAPGMDGNGMGAGSGLASPPPKGSNRRWLIPLVLVACAAASFAIVMLLLNRDDGGSSATSTPARTVTQQSTTPSGASTPSSASSTSGAASATSSSASSASASSSSATTAAFPADAVTTCGGGSHHRDEKRESLDESVRVTAKNDGTPSCEFVRKIQGDIASALTKDPSASQFTFQETSVRQTRAPYPVSCTRKDHLSTCQVNNSAPFDYVIYVRDSVG